MGLGAEFIADPREDEHTSNLVYSNNSSLTNSVHQLSSHLIIFTEGGVQ